MKLVEIIAYKKHYTWKTDSFLHERRLKFYLLYCQCTDHRVSEVLLSWWFQRGRPVRTRVVGSLVLTTVILHNEYGWKWRSCIPLTHIAVVSTAVAEEPVRTYRPRLSSKESKSINSSIFIIHLQTMASQDKKQETRHHGEDLGTAPIVLRLRTNTGLTFLRTSTGLTLLWPAQERG